MNRRLSVGILLSAIPIPGMMHDYAGEKEKAKKIRYIAAGCISAMILGATSHQKGDFPKSDFDKHIINADQDNERQFEMIPTHVFSDDTTYILKEIYRDTKSSPASILLPIGFIGLIGNYIYDYIYGIKTIELKRDEIRFKYGKMLNFSFTPSYNFKNNTAGVNMTFRF